MRRDTGDALVQIASAPNQIIADLWRELLGGEGIPVLLQPTALLGYTTFASPYDLLVRRADAERARDLLAAFEADEANLLPGETALDDDEPSRDQR